MNLLPFFLLTSQPGHIPGLKQCVLVVQEVAAQMLREKAVQTVTCMHAGARDSMTVQVASIVPGLASPHSALLTSANHGAVLVASVRVAEHASIWPAMLMFRTFRTCLQRTAVSPAALLNLLGRLDGAFQFAPSDSRLGSMRVHYSRTIRSRCRRMPSASCNAATDKAIQYAPLAKRTSLR